MRLILHLGAHGTDDGLIAGWIARNRGALGSMGIAAPEPQDFVTRVAKALDVAAKHEPLAREEALLRGLGASARRRWMVVSAPDLLGPATDVVSAEGFYAKAVVRRLSDLHSLFPRCRITVLLAVRGASALLPRLAPQAPDFLTERLPLLALDTLPWARLVASLRHHLPHARTVIWRQEDLAQVWPAVLTQIVGPERIVPPAGLVDFAALALGAEARVRLLRYLTRNPPRRLHQLKRMAEAFGSRYGTCAPQALPETLPAWVGVELMRLDAGYGTEWDDICARDGVLALRV